MFQERPAPGATARRMAHDGAKFIPGTQSAGESACDRAAARNAHLRRQSNRHQGVDRCGHVREPSRGVQQCGTFRSYEEQLSWRCWLVRRRAPAITGRPYLQPAASERRRSSWPDRLCQFVDPARTVKCATCGAPPSSTSVAVLEAPGSRLARASCTPLGSARKLPRATTSDKGWRAADTWTICRPVTRAVSPTVSCGRSAAASACPGHQSSLLPLTRDTTPSTAARMYGQLTFEYCVYTMAIIPAMALPMEILVYTSLLFQSADLPISSWLERQASWRQMSLPCPSWGS